MVKTLVITARHILGYMDYKVSSEIFSEENYITNKKPTLQDNVVSIFKFIIPEIPKLDSDGDFELQRHIKHEENTFKHIEIEHKTSTELNLVGLQIWRGALLLADWLIFNNKSLPDNCLILELGSGVGLTSIVASMFKPVLCTDINEGGILSLLRNNIDRNKSLAKFPVSILELNFFSENFSTEIINLLPDVKVILAADVIYDNHITCAFVSTLRKLLLASPESTVYIALEKRYVFLAAECSTCAPCYEYFLECLQQYQDLKADNVVIDFPQFFLYNRIKELVIWKIILQETV